MSQMMDEKTARAVIRFLAGTDIPKLDITGGAPELHPHFEYLVREGRALGRHVMDRCNLTVFFEKGMGHLPQFLRDHQVEIIASLPCYSRDNVDKQRGKGTFDGSIEALLWLNRLGYGRGDTDLILNLVYNPVGPHLPPPQEKLERDYKERLSEDFGIVFNRLYCITNMPITRYARYLRAIKAYEAYVSLLLESFNFAAVEGLMCRNTLSVGWDGRLYDCDFNLALKMNLDGVSGSESLHIENVSMELLADRDIMTGEHCFGCTAGAGSSCGGQVTSPSSLRSSIPYSN